MTNREAAKKLAEKITGESVNAQTTKEALDAIAGKPSETIAEAIDNIAEAQEEGTD